MKHTVALYTDGGARGNPGPAGAGAVVYENGKETATVSRFLGVQTNNWAEYEALILALDTARKKIKNISSYTVMVHMDSELIVKQMKGEYKVRDSALKKQHARVQEILKKYFSGVSFTHVRREMNTRADELANQAMDSAQ